jgi:5-methylcytosine-specific restriction endonuclease McrBC GTP-binding regulatory subunit McrB
MDANVEEIASLLESDRFIILEGIPGVGKTHLFNKLEEKKLFDKTYFLTFHPSTDYSEFVGGIKPGVTTQNKLQFKPSQGHILNAIEEAKNGKKILVWIDELNRGNVPLIFGDLITLLGNSDPPTLDIPSVGLIDDVLRLEEKGLYGLEFYVVATLNQSDKSVTPLDAAIRRRFGFFPLTNLPIDAPEIKKLANISNEEKEKFYSLNEFLSTNIGPEEQLGHSYLFKLDKLKEVDKKKLFWQHKIIPNIIEFLPKNKSHDLHDSINTILADKDLGIEMEGAENAPTFLSKFEESFGHTDDEIAKTIGNLLTMTSNVVLEGVPGTGKTRIRNLVAKELGIDEDHVMSTTFHPSTSYQEFIGGLYPAYDHSKPDELLFKFKKGTLIKAANRAMKKPKENFLLFIDEINRGNIPMILGELMTIMEHTKRVEPDGKDAYREFEEKRENQVIIHHEKDLTYYLQIPNNLYILATMNTSDRSVVSFDAAMRRRFSYFRMESLLNESMPPKFKKKIEANWSQYSGYSSASLDEVIDCLVKINSILRNKLGPDAELGHSYSFLKGANLSFQEAVQRLFHNKILPQIADTISTWNISSNTIVSEINLLLSKLSQEKRLCEKGLVILKHKINPNFSQIRVSKEGLRVEITLDLIRSLKIGGNVERSIKERAYFLLLLNEYVSEMKHELHTSDTISELYLRAKKTILNEFNNSKLSTVRQNISDHRNDPEVLELITDLIRNPSRENKLIHDYLNYKRPILQRKVDKVRWVFEELIRNLPNFSDNIKPINSKKTVYRFEQLNPTGPRDTLLDATFEILSISDSEIEIEFQSSTGGSNKDYRKGFSDSLMKTLDVHGIEVLSMGTKVGQGFVNVPDFNSPSLPRTIGEWNNRWKNIPGVTGSGNPGIKLVLKNKFDSEDERFLARVISGHPVWIKSE